MFLLKWLVGVLQRRHQTLSVTVSNQTDCTTIFIASSPHRAALVALQIFVATPAMCHLRSKTDSNACSDLTDSCGVWSNGDLQSLLKAVREDFLIFCSFKKSSLSV